MKTLTTAALAVLMAASSLAAHVGAADAAAFWAWRVADVSWGDTLNIRAYPSSKSRIQSSYPNGTVLQMTGRCTDGLDLGSIAHLSNQKQRQAVRYRWCEVWHDPARDENFVTGWVYGRYLAPA